MRCFKVKIVIWSIKVRGHDRDEFCSILPVVDPAHFYSGYLCNSIG